MTFDVWVCSVQSVVDDKGRPSYDKLDLRSLPNTDKTLDAQMFLTFSDLIKKPHGLKNHDRVRITLEKLEDVPESQ